MLGISSSSSSSSSPTEVIEFQEGGRPSLDVIVEVTGFDNTTIEGAALGTGRGEAVRSIPCTALFGPLDGPGGDGRADTIHAGSSGAANPSIPRNSCSTSLSSARNNETFSTGGKDRTNGGSLGRNKTSKVRELSST